MTDTHSETGRRDRLRATLRSAPLTGALRSQSLRAMAERDAWYCYGVDEVVNAIEVEP